MRFFIAIPTYNGGNIWKHAVDNIKKYAPEKTFVQVIDSGSKDDTVEIAKKAGFNVISIKSDEFNHGDTRNRAVYTNITDFDIVIFLTQDAIPRAGFVENIIKIFSDDKVACAYGRQLPHEDANPIAIHARNFNYPESSHINDGLDASKTGLKSVFMSNSFSAYRISVFNELGGFPDNTILCEDMFYAAKAISAGYKTAYVANAMVEHSHNYSLFEEFKRYFDIGVFHRDQAWIKKKFGGPRGEGTRFLVSEVKYILPSKYLWLIKAIANNFMKILGYKLGSKYNILPIFIVKKFSMHYKYWENK